MPDLEDITPVETTDQGSRSRKARVLGRLNSFSKLGHWRKKEEESKQIDRNRIQEDVQEEDAPRTEETAPAQQPVRQLSQRSRSLSPQARKVVPELPRQLTFSRQYSERRERLEQHEPDSRERRAYSEDRHIPSARDDIKFPGLSLSSAQNSEDEGTYPVESSTVNADDQSNDQFEARSPPLAEGSSTNQPDGSTTLLEQPDPASSESQLPDQDESDEVENGAFQEELDSRWILNLSMHFRDKSDREKFFITYAQKPNLWRRLTISCDYRNAEVDSLEYDLKRRHTQRDKSSKIYEAIRESLPDIQFLDTVTNLKLTTEDGRLHVHVTEDLNEVIKYPSVSLLSHVMERHPIYPESELEFKQHLSGFVYKVYTGSEYLIKKEIPGPETIDEFLYEIAALDTLRSSESVIRFRGLVVDDDKTLVKAILISFASRGSLIDMIYDERAKLKWSTRCRWAGQIIKGLSEIHEAGFVQGDFTLSNIVIDHEDDAKIIDINRRGCPVGWEPPELRPLIGSGQRIAMMIGVKTDIYQLGMVLWALAERIDEPERIERPLYEYEDPDLTVPGWYRGMIQSCLSEIPQRRLNATDLLAIFDKHSDYPRPSQKASRGVEFLDHSVISVSSHRSDKEYIDPDTAVDLEDIAEHSQADRSGTPLQETAGRSNWVATSSTAEYQYDSSGSYVVTRGRSLQSTRRRSSPQPRSLSSATSPSLASDGEPKWEHIDADQSALQHTFGQGRDRNFSPNRVPLRRDTPGELAITPPHKSAGQSSPSQCYRCCIAGCPSADTLYNSRDKFRDHILHIHLANDNTEANIPEEEMERWLNQYVTHGFCARSLATNSVRQISP